LKELIKQYDIWLANLNPASGSFPGKARPVLIIQSDLLNNQLESTIVCPITSNVIQEAKILRVHIPKGQLDTESNILVDQIRTIDNGKLIQKISRLNYDQIKRIKKSLEVVLDF
jgi:mRNA interferase MazF